ncbi:MAG: rod shape-determining protein MreD [Armatimonadota bacterium]|nr:rod shape-determining protein MreD [Armatimonadota bacterium]MDR5702854.1 rod shape-determining protein MreD [Armatimonadota bacterium]
MRVTLIFLVILVTTIVQTTWLMHIAIMGVVLDPVLPLVMAIGLLRGPEEGALFGLAGGLAQDLFGGTSLGLMGMAKLSLGYLSGFLRAGLYLESPLPVLVVTGLGTFLHEAIWTSLAALTGQFQVLFLQWIEKALLQALYNAPFGPLFLALLRGIEERFSGSRQSFRGRSRREGGR